MPHPYHLADVADVFSPGLVFYKDLIRHNIALIEMAGGPERLRPHVKTHKTREIVRMELDAGITKHKCATLAEAEMLARLRRARRAARLPAWSARTARAWPRLVRKYPRLPLLRARRSSRRRARRCPTRMAAAGPEVDVLLDLDVGQHRTGIAPGPDGRRRCTSRSPDCPA